MKTSPTIRCNCGPKAKVSESVQQVGAERRIYYRCETCGTEWTVIQQTIDLRDPVTSDEIIDVRELLEHETPTIKEMLGL